MTKIVVFGAHRWAEGIRVANECLIGMGVPLQRNTREREAYVARQPELLGRPTNELGAWLSWPVD